jgi:DNA repair protein RadC
MVRDNKAGTPLVLDTYTAANIFGHSIGDVLHEELWMLMVDSQTRISGSMKISQGGMHSCSILPKDLLMPLVASGCCGFILGHNHPSGDPTPSRDDIILTTQINKSANVLGIPLLDHIVIAYNTFGKLTYKSFHENDLIEH